MTRRLLRSLTLFTELTFHGDVWEMWRSGKMPGLAPGMVLGGRYRLESVLGRGVMGQVGQGGGRPPPPPRPVTAKTVATELLAVASSRAAALTRFRRETRAAARLDH